MMIENKFETVGKVKLDLEYYQGEDKYCDGPVEDELLEAVKRKNSDYKAVIKEKNNWPFLYHLSPQRANIVNWLPISKTDKVLEVGSGCGAITTALASKCRELTCIDLSKKRSLINAYRNKNENNITIKVGNFQDIEDSLDRDFDYILLIGVFEYAQAYIAKDSPYTEFLNIIKKHLKNKGRIVIAIENRMGLKYLAGCMEDHLGEYFTGIENYPKPGIVRTFTRPALENILKECNIEEYSFYYPYPDYKFMHSLYSDKRLPYKGELTTNLRNFDRDRILLFDEKNAFDSIIADGEFPYFSNSYELIIGPDIETAYCKFSNDRAEKYAIRTDIISNDKGKMAVKYPVADKSFEHIQKIYDASKKLMDRYAGSDLKICPCKMLADHIEFDYINGITLEEKLDGLLDKTNEFEAYIKEYYEKISYNENSPVTDYDLIFSNIIIDENNSWTVIDYEWTFDKKIEAKYILARALYCYKLGSEKRKLIDCNSILCKLTGQTDLYQEEKLKADEINFQKQVTDQYMSLSEIRDSIHYEVLPLSDAINRYVNWQQEKQIQIYYDRANGFSEADSVNMYPASVNGENIIEIKLSDNIINVRFDPKRKPCIIKMLTAFIETEKGDRIMFPMKKIIHNGLDMKDDCIAFNHNDPNITFLFKYLKKYKAVNGDKLIITYEELA